MLKGKSAIVTGSTSGIGRGIAHALAKEGVNIMTNGFGDTPETIATVKSEITAFGVKAEYNPADVGKPDQIDAMIDATMKSFGSVDIVVNNAGIQFVSPIESFPLDKWDAIIATNLSSAFYTTRRAVPFMRSKGWGRIINIASAHGLVASAGKAAYVAAKHGIVGLSKVTALETAKDGITCNAICPGWVLTPLVQKQIDAAAAKEGTTKEEEAKKFLAEKQPAMQFVTPEEIGGLVVFLCSDYAKLITGSAYSIDGGWVAE
ncbi:MAG TPA: 3-hydroxybutyrate dehydrogenase [Alphaproteobacteria bacterium]|nr:3-hydroxybutyrate dehydrogenase [Alphaproteobacteria bacterium]